LTAKALRKISDANEPRIAPAQYVRNRVVIKRRRRPSLSDIRPNTSAPIISPTR